MAPLRSTVAIPEEVQEAVEKHREELGLPTEGPASRVYGQLMLEGLRMREEVSRRREALAAYEEWSGNAEQREAVQELTSIAEEAGWL